MNRKKSLLLSLALVSGMALASPPPAWATTQYDKKESQEVSRLVLPGRVIPDVPLYLDEKETAKLVAEINAKFSDSSVAEIPGKPGSAEVRVMPKTDPTPTPTPSESSVPVNSDSANPSASTSATPTPSASPVSSSETATSNSDTSAATSTSTTPVSDVAPAPAATNAVPNPNPALDFKNIKEDPDTYGLPKSAEQFKQGSKYQIPAPANGGKAVGEYDSSLLKYYAQKVTWGSCEPFGYAASSETPNANKQVQCAYAIVPMDYQKPDGPTIAVGMLKVLSKAGDKKKGTVFTDPGGPGGSGMESAFNMLNSPVLENFDIIGFDPRGVGSSLPQIRCESSDAKDKQRQYTDAISGEEQDKILKYNTDKCYENTGKVFSGLSGKSFIPQVGTGNVVRDLDVMRSIVGDEKLSYIGFSYGTSIGYRYAQLFPSHIRALILDGQVNPYQNNPDLLKKYEEKKILASSTEVSSVSQMRGFNDTFKQFIKSCLKGEVPGYKTENTKESCPLRADKDPIANPTEEQIQTAYAEYQKLARAAWNTGYYQTKDGRAVSYGDITQGTIMAMYSDSIWRYLKYGLQLLKDNKNASVMMFLSDYYYNRSPEGKYDFSDASFRSISCTDSWQDSENREESVEIGKAAYKVAPFLDPGKDENGKQLGLEASYGWCHFYETRKQLPKGEELDNAPNVLVISSSYDPATPYANGVVAAMGLKGTLLSVANNSHCAFGKVDCATTVSLEYLNDPVKFLASMNSGKYDSGKESVQTRHIYSDKDVTGYECHLDYYGARLKAVSGDKEITEVKQPDNDAKVQAAGFLPGEKVEFALKDGTKLGSVTADENGKAELALANLSALPLGDVIIVAKQNTFIAELSLKVSGKKPADDETPAVGPETSGAAVIPNFGIDSSGMGIALLLVLAGSVGIATRRKKLISS